MESKTTVSAEDLAVSTEGYKEMVFNRLTKLFMLSIKRSCINEVVFVSGGFGDVNVKSCVSVHGRVVDVLNVTETISLDSERMESPIYLRDMVYQVNELCKKVERNIRISRDIHEGNYSSLDEALKTITRKTQEQGNA